MKRFDIHRVLERLAEKRPVFHSEADFRFALAWQIEKMTPDAGVRLEWPFSLSGSNRYLDIWLRTAGIAIELKYRTRLLSIEHGGERFSLKNKMANNYGRYGFIDDIRRIERIAADLRTVDRSEFSHGYAVLLTNDPLYWRVGGKGANDEEFRIHEDRLLTGTMDWTKGPSKGMTKNHRHPLTLSGSYELHWEDYIEHSGKNGTFRYLAVQIS